MGSATILRMRRRHDDVPGEIRDAVERINSAWLEGTAEAMRDDLHENVVMVQPGFAETVVGRDACIASYAEFSAAAEIEHFETTEPVVEVRDATAVAWIAWHMTYVMDGVRSDEAGHDIFVFGFDGDDWRLVWRTLTTAPVS